MFNALDGSPLRIEFTPFIQSNGSDLLRELVIRGTGLALLPTWMLQEPEGDGRVVRRLLLQASKPWVGRSRIGPGAATK